MIKVYDDNGNEKNMLWVQVKYNLPPIMEAPRDKDHWEVLELRERIGPVAMRIRAVGKMIYDVPILVEWPDDHIVQVTNLLGYTDFVLGAYYRPPKVGPYSVQVSDPLVPSDVIRGLGMLGKTEHAHLEPTFAFMKGSTEPPPSNCEEYISALERVREIVNSVHPVQK